MRILLLCLCVLTSALRAQDGRIQGPSLGVVWHEATRTLRPVWGVFGAAWLGDALASEANLESAAVAPQAEWAIGRVSHDGRSVAAVLTWAQGRVNVQELPDLPAGASPVVFSPSGTFAFAGFFRLPRPGSSPEVQAPLAGQPESSRVLAVSDSGAALMAAPDGGQWALYRADPQGMARLATIPAVDGAAFLPDSPVAFVAAGTDLYRIEADGTVNPWMAIEPARGLAAEAGRLLVAMEKSVLLVDAATGETAARVECECQPTVLQAAARSLFWLTAATAQPAWMLNAATGAVRFVPTPSGVEEPAQ